MKGEERDPADREDADLQDILQDTIDRYASDELDEDGVRRLEAAIREHPEARRLFVRYCRMHTDLFLLARAKRAGDRALAAIEGLAGQTEGGPPSISGPGPGTRRRRRAPASIRASAAIAASLLVAVSVTWRLSTGAAGERAVAWLVNAQNCLWADSGIAGDLVPGRSVELRRGLAELRFASGATVILQGPARLTPLSGGSARLARGRLSAKVPEKARGFQVLLAGGRVVDLGTEFGVSVDEDGSAEVRVFSGRVEAIAGSGPSVNISASRMARIAGGEVAVEPGTPPEAGDGFVRAIVPPPAIVPRTLLLDFRRPLEGTILDAAGAGTGLTHRLPGTGASLPRQDVNLRLDPSAGRLELTTTKSDINTQYLLEGGEYLGVRLADLGFTGVEDFEITMLVPDIPALQAIGQFGLYAGSGSNRVIRGGLISREEPGRYGQFLVNNAGGRDSDLNVVGLLSSGESLRLTLIRTDNRYALTVENQATGAASTLTIRHPDFLDREKDLHVGVFGANTASDVRKTLLIREIYVTVRTKVGAMAR